MLENQNYVLVTVSGKDRPGIAAGLTRIVADHGVEIVDIDQATLHDFLGLSFLLNLSSAGQTGTGVLKDLLFEASRLDMTLNFQLLSEKELPDKQDKKLFVLTFFGGTRSLAAISQILAEEAANIEKISNLSLNTADCIELIINTRHVANLTRLKERLTAKSYESNIDIAMQAMETYRKSKRLVFFDMDQTLIDDEIIDEMARVAGTYDEVSRVTERAMRGDMDFEDSLRQRVAFLSGLTLSQLEDIRSRLVISEGAGELVAILKRLGYKLGVISGGFDYFADYLKDKLNLDFAYANHLEIKDSLLTGRLAGDVIDAAQKAKLVNRVSNEMGIPLDQTVAIGDGANDRLMLGQAGVGIAYNAARGLATAVGTSVGRARLMNVLYILGVTEKDLRSTP